MKLLYAFDRSGTLDWEDAPGLFFAVVTPEFFAENGCLDSTSYRVMDELPFEEMMEATYQSRLTEVQTREAMDSAGHEHSPVLEAYINQPQ